MNAIRCVIWGALFPNFRSAWMVSVALLSLGAIPADAASTQEIGSVARPDYNGAVVRAVGGGDLHPIRYRDAVFSLDTVITGPLAATSLTFLDATRIDIGPEAEVRLDAFIYDPASTIGAGEMSFAVGAFRYVGGKMSTEENIRLKTPTATMVIRGTELIIFVWPDGRTEVNVVSGAVEVSACGSAGAGQLAMSGMRVTVLPTCSVQVAAVRTLPADLGDLALPNEFGDAGGENSDDGGKDRRRDGRNTPASAPKSGTDKGTNNKGAATNGSHI